MSTKIEDGRRGLAASTAAVLSAANYAFNDDADDDFVGNSNRFVRWRFRFLGRNANQ